MPIIFMMDVTSSHTIQSCVSMVMLNQMKLKMRHSHQLKPLSLYLEETRHLQNNMKNACLREILSVTHRHLGRKFKSTSDKRKT